MTWGQQPQVGAQGRVQLSLAVCASEVDTEAWVVGCNPDMIGPCGTPGTVRRWNRRKRNLPLGCMIGGIRHHFLIPGESIGQ